MGNARYWLQNTVHIPLKGLVLNIVGLLVSARLSYFHETNPLESTAVRIWETPGPLEASDFSVIGMEENGNSHLHFHLTVTSGKKTICGHLEKGAIVRSVLSRSYFTILIASIVGYLLKLIWDKEAARQFPERFPLGAPCHKLVQIEKS